MIIILIRLAQSIMGKVFRLAKHNFFLRKCWQPSFQPQSVALESLHKDED